MYIAATTKIIRGFTGPTDMHTITSKR
uniref:Uncharacterized protein n=1 Tax=Arundo donax TaxID=35708 RepID=A0A0A8ZWQ4_ARUDO